MKKAVGFLCLLLCLLISCSKDKDVLHRDLSNAAWKGKCEGLRNGKPSYSHNVTISFLDHERVIMSYADADYRKQPVHSSYDGKNLTIDPDPKVLDGSLPQTSTDEGWTGVWLCRWEGEKLILERNIQDPDFWKRITLVQTR